MLTKDQQAVLLHDAARCAGMDGHVKTCGSTAAEKIMRMFGGRQNTPRKTSYLYMDSVDACFFYQNDKACVTMSARWFAGAKDLEGGKLDEAGRLIRIMLEKMQELADAALAGQGAADGD